MKRIATALDVSLSDLISTDPLVINNQESNYGAQGKIENFYSENKDAYEKLIYTMSQQIEQMKVSVELLSRK